ncbi:hypothetical protein pdam_00018815 [Pocillopora damicornis]|uniref:Uncharacterized protein n=1 Tax=Pocillopora damicornis TaxID=46731 RepID=A0A3M6UD32_POCDA|nr:hypothetical protein pdam_00018815 [Pocillopora damicornis]
MAHQPRSYVKILILRKWRIGSLVIIGSQAKRELLTALLIGGRVAQAVESPDVDRGKANKSVEKYRE